MAKFVSLVNKLASLWRMPLSRQLQYFGFMRDRLITRWIYSWRLKVCGKNSIIGRPLFWTPESISVGRNVLIWPGCRLEVVAFDGEASSSSEILIGDGVSFQQRCHVTSGSKLVIGANTTILFDVMITDIDHQYDEIGRNIMEQAISVRTTKIGENCFIGSGAKIQAGTKLGRQCIVGANAVVRGDFPDYCVVAGVPARILKRYNPHSGVWRRTDVKGDYIDD